MIPYVEQIFEIREAKELLEIEDENLQEAARLYLNPSKEEADETKIERVLKSAKGFYWFEWHTEYYESEEKKYYIYKLKDIALKNGENEENKGVNMVVNLAERENIAKIELIKALVKFQQECPKIPYDAKVSVRTRNGGVYEFEYATLAKIKEITTPILTKYGLAVIQRLEPVENGTKLITEVLHEAGGKEKSEIILPFKQGMSNQEMGAVITYFRRYSYTTILGIVAEEDDDANIADGNSFTKEDIKKGEKKEEQGEKKEEKSLSVEDIDLKIKELRDAGIEVKNGKAGWYIDENLSKKPKLKKMVKEAGFNYNSSKKIWALPYPEPVVK